MLPYFRYCMTRCCARGLLVLGLSLVLAHDAVAQRARKPRGKPFAALNESAHRLKDSLSARLTTPSSDPFSAAEILSSANAMGDAILRDSVMAVARSQLGTSYRLGAQLPGKAFDCSGLIKYVMGMLRLELPRTANEQSKMGREVARDTSALRPGDLLTFGSAKRITHIGIYAGNGRVIHASTSRRRVIETSMASLGPSLLGKWRSARRLIAMADRANETTADWPEKAAPFTR